MNDPNNIQGAFGKLPPDPRRLDKDVPIRDDADTFECMNGHEHLTQIDADKCKG